MQDMTYEAALKELQSIVDAIQDNSLGMDELSSQLSRAAELISFCREKLHKTDEEIKGLFSAENE
ncbi:MAG: exodeoxyribonuclease VII small subunit [Lewinella sp.]|nr:exodeoxyribonuclease VII small subunit [Lewinella sp.]